MSPRYRAYSGYLRERYGGRAVRVSVDPGFGCPHGGCAFCRDHGASVAPVAPAGQIRARLERVRGDPALLLYFQGGTSTHAPVDRLRRTYDEALAQAPFRELIVGTRPDCVDNERADLLAAYVRPGFDVWVELGLQSAHDRTLRLLDRGHDVECYRAAADLLRSKGIRVAAHLIHGLPGESRDDFLETVSWVAATAPDGVKIHNLHVLRGTTLERMYRRGEITVPGVPAHLDAVAHAIELLPPATVVIRVLTDSEPADLLAPRVFADKSRFLRELDRTLERRGTRQGSRVTSHAQT